MTIAPPKRLAGKHILLVDDDPDIRRFVCAILTFEGSNCQEASSGEEALEILALARAIDLVVLDLDLPGISGWEVLGRLAGSRTDVKIVILTGNCEPDVVERSVSQGAMGCIMKPVSAGSLVARISSLVS